MAGRGETGQMRREGAGPQVLRGAILHPYLPRRTLKSFVFAH